MLDQIFALEPAIPVPQQNSYIESYPYLCAHFGTKTVLEPSDVVLGAHMVYDWMPTVLGLDTAAVRGCTLQQAAALLTAAKQRDLDKAELLSLKGMINNSIVGRPNYCISSPPRATRSGIHASMRSVTAGVVMPTR